MKFKGFYGKELELRLKKHWGIFEKHDHIEVWDGKVRLCDMHIADSFVHVFRDAKTNPNNVYVALHSNYFTTKREEV